MNTAKIILSTFLGIFSISSCSNSAGNQALREKATVTQNINSKDSMSVIYFAGGCFWGTDIAISTLNYSKWQRMPIKKMINNIYIP